MVSALNSGTSASPASMNLLRCLSFYGAAYGFCMSSVHVPGAHNTVADAISRNNITVVNSVLSQASRELIPTPVVDLLVTARPEWGSETWTQLLVRSLTEELRTPL